MNDTVKPGASASAAMLQEFGRAWRVMIVIVLGMCVGAMPSYSIAVFIAPISGEYGWTATQVTGWSMAYALACVAAAPLVGLLADRLGARRVAFVALMALGLSLFATAIGTSSLVRWYASGFAVGLSSVGTAAVTYGRVIAGLFDKGLGTAFGLMSVGTGLSAIVGPPALRLIVDHYGWRAGFQCEALLPFFVLALATFWLREGAEPSKKAVEPGLPIRTAITGPLFWLIAVATVFYGMAASGLTVNLVSYVVADGMSRAAAAGALGVMGAATMVGRFGTGLLIDRFRLNAAFFMVGALAVQAGVYVMFATTELQFLWLGTGPVLFSALQEASGGYDIPLWIFGAVAAAALPLMVVTGLAMTRRTAVVA